MSFMEEQNVPLKRAECQTPQVGRKRPRTSQSSSIRRNKVCGSTTWSHYTCTTFSVSQSLHTHRKDISTNIYYPSIYPSIALSRRSTVSVYAHMTYIHCVLPPCLGGVSTRSPGNLARKEASAPEACCRDPEITFTKDCLNSTSAQTVSKSPPTQTRRSSQSHPSHIEPSNPHGTSHRIGMCAKKDRVLQEVFLICRKAEASYSFFRWSFPSKTHRRNLLGSLKRFCCH